MNDHHRPKTRPYSPRQHPGRPDAVTTRISADAKRLLVQLANGRRMSKSEYLARLLNDHLRVAINWRIQR